MCGIAGYTGTTPDCLLDTMLTTLRHRGPDDSGTLLDPPVHLGMVRLAIIDLAGGHQPMSNPSGSLHVVFNGEIFNYVELRAELEALGHRFVTHSDTETILHAYEEWGEEFAHHLNGMFAIALWDRARRVLHVYRDRFGVKPLYYARLGGEIVFASEIKALLRHPGVGRELDPAAVSHYLSLRNVPAPFTIYREIRSLPPGWRFTWTANHEGGDRLRLDRWYELRMTGDLPEGDEETLVEQLDELLRDSVRIRMRADVGYGAYLSGGIDSSTVVAMMSRHSSQPVRTFTLAYAEQQAHKVDSYYARRVAEAYGTEHHEYAMRADELAREAEAILGHMDQPFAGVIASYWLSRFMRQSVTVALSGDGADDVFGSYGHHRLVWPIEAVRRRREMGTHPAPEDYGHFRDRPELVERLSNLEPWEWRLAYAAFMDTEKPSCLSPEGREWMLGHSTPALLRGIYEESPPSTDSLNRMLYLDIKTLMPNEVLCFNDMLSMAHSLEVRTPFLDYRIVELACRVPGTLKIRGATLKYILRRVAARYLPPEVLERGKEGFVLPKNTWLRLDLADWLRAWLSRERVEECGLFDWRYIDGLLNRFLAGDESLTFRVWTLAAFQVWWHGRPR